MVEIITLDGSIGTILIAIILAMFMFGILSLQVYVYLISYPNDSRLQRYFVRAVWVVDLAHTVLISAMAYHYMVTNFANPSALEHIHWTLDVALIIEAILTLLVQSFLAYRTYRIQKKFPIFVVILFFSFAQLAFGSATGVYSLLKVKTFEQVQLTIPRVLATVWCATAVICDVLTMFGLVSTLNQSRTGFRRSDHIISKLSKWAIETGIATALFAIADLIFFVFVHNLAHLIFNFVLAKLYTNTMMSTLNARQSLNRNVSGAEVYESGHEFSSRGREVPNRFPKNVTNGRLGTAESNSKGNVGIGITVTTIQHADDMWDQHDREKAAPPNSDYTHKI